MEPQLHHIHGRHYDDHLQPTGTDVHEEQHEHGGETKSAMKKVKEKIEKLKDTIKHGHGHGEDHDHDTKAVNDSAPVRSGMVQRTVMGQPVLAEDLYATHSDIVDPLVRSFAEWEDEERVGAPPPLSTGYGTHLTDPSQVGHHVYQGPDVNHEQIELLTGSAVKSTGMEEDPNAPNVTTAVSPANHQTKVTDATNTGGKEAGITDVLKSFDKMGVYDEPHSEYPKSDQIEPEVYTGSHDQFVPEVPVENPPLDTIAADPSNPNSSYAQKVTSATSAMADKAAAAKDTIASKLGFSGDNKGATSTGSNKTNKNSSFSTDFAHKVADTMTGTFVPVYEKVVGAKTTVMSKIQGSGYDDDGGTPATSAPESKKVTVREYLVDTFRPGEEDKELSEVITNAFHRGKGNVTQETTTIIVRDEGERRLQEN